MQATLHPLDGLSWMHRPLSYLLLCFASAGWSCTGANEEARNQSQAEVNLARAMFTEEHNPRGAIAAAEAAIRHDGESPDAYMVLGQIYGAEGLYDRAEAPLRRAVALYIREGDTARAQLAEARNALGAVLVNLQRYDEAITVLRPVTEEVLYASPHLAWGNLGNAYLRQGDYHRAVEALQRSVGYQQEFCVGRFHLGEAFHRLGDEGHALEELNRAVGTRQTGCDHIQEAFLVRAEVHVALHQPDAAQLDIARCVALDAQTPTGQACTVLGRSVTP